MDVYLFKITSLDTLELICEDKSDGEEYDLLLLLLLDDGVDTSSFVSLSISLISSSDSSEVPFSA